MISCKPAQTSSGVSVSNCSSNGMTGSVISRCPSFDFVHPETLQCKDGAALLNSEMSRSLIRIFHKKVQNIHMLIVRGNPLSPCLRRLENNYLRSVVPIQ